MKLIETIKELDSKRVYVLNFPVYYEKKTPFTIRRRLLCFRWEKDIKGDFSPEPIGTETRRTANTGIDVSIIVPVYNAAPYLKVSVESLLSQDDKNLEFIFIDDASTDNSVNILKSFTDPRIKIITFKNNQGVAAARNIGLSIAKGTYIGFLDPDDYVSKNYFGHLYKVGRLNDADMVVTTSIKRVDVSGKVVGRKFSGVKANKTRLSIRDRMRLVCTTGVAWNKIYKRDLLLSNSINYPEIKTMGTDNYFTSLSLVFAKNIQITNNATYFYRENPVSIIRKKKDSSYYKLVDVYSRTLLRISEADIPGHRKAEWCEAIRYRAVNDFHSNLKGFDNENDRAGFCAYVNQNFPELGFAPLEKPVISLTSYPGRIKTLDGVIDSLKNQNVDFEKVVLWLSKLQFKNLDADLPSSLLRLQDDKFEIRWVEEDIRSYKKLIPALLEYPDKVIITADDDVIYPSDWAERLLRSYAADPTCVHCLRGRQIKASNGKIETYKSWNLVEQPLFPAYDILPTGVGGCLYKRELLDENIFNAEEFNRIATDCDDLWFWAMALKRGTKIKIATPTYTKPNIIEGTQDNALWNQNSIKNDHYFSLLINEFPDVRQKLFGKLS